MGSIPAIRVYLVYIALAFRSKLWYTSSILDIRVSNNPKSSNVRLTERLELESAYWGSMLKDFSLGYLPTVKTGMV